MSNKSWAICVKLMQSLPRAIPGEKVQVLRVRIAMVEIESKRTICEFEFMEVNCNRHAL